MWVVIEWFITFQKEVIIFSYKESNQKVTDKKKCLERVGDVYPIFLLQERWESETLSQMTRGDISPLLIILTLSESRGSNSILFPA